MYFTASLYFMNVYLWLSARHPASLYLSCFCLNEPPKRKKRLSSCKSHIVIVTKFSYFVIMYFYHWEKIISQFIKSCFNLKEIKISIKQTFWRWKISIKTSFMNQNLIQERCFIKKKNLVIFKELFEKINGLQEAMWLSCERAIF